MQQHQQEPHQKEQQKQHHPRNLLGNLFLGPSVDLESCYANLRTSDYDGDGKLSPEEFMNFVQISAAGKLDKNQYGLPITAFYMLPQEFIGTYNSFACGDTNYGCPSVEGINISGVAEVSRGSGGERSEQQEALLFQLCKTTKGGTEKLTEGPTDGPTDRGTTLAPSLKEVHRDPTLKPTLEPTDGTFGQNPTPTGESFPTRSPAAIASAPASSEPISSQFATPLLTATRAPPDVAFMPLTAAVGGGDGGGKELYSGSLFVLFQYKIYNTWSLDAESTATGYNPDNDAMAALLDSTTVFVEGVVVGTFVRADGIVDAQGKKRQVRGLRRKRRGLEVLLPPGSVSITDITGVECSTERRAISSACQKVTVVAILTLTEEPGEATLLRVQNAIDVALEDPGITFPEDSGIVYAGPMSVSEVIITQPAPGKSKGSGEGTLGWAVLVSILVATIGSAVLLLFVVARWYSCCLSDHAKRWQTGGVSDSRAVPQSAPDDDLVRHSGLRPTDNRLGPNPFMGGDSDSVTNPGGAMLLAFDSSTTSRMSSLSSHLTKDIWISITLPVFNFFESK